MVPRGRRRQGQEQPILGFQRHEAVYDSQRNFEEILTASIVCRMITGPQDWWPNTMRQEP